ncbi:developmental pluripotency-associated 5 protein [Balaenoptera ricei]|uniref:developmental pluripotency-associated 5 protein n=1 Tax=Balaenoptera ricei TaxID=2746895 RepID=UPI0028BDE546|nr:developmental pluripotency-associated 5 protein [Balaenoptera ricei]
MGKLPERNDIPPWVGAPEVLKEPGVFQVQTGLLEAVFRPDGSRIPFVEQVSKVVLQMKGLETSDLAEVMVYGSYLCKFQTKWVLQSVAWRHRQRRKQGMLQPEEAMNSLDVAPRMKGSQFAARPTWDRGRIAALASEGKNCHLRNAHESQPTKLGWFKSFLVQQLR